ncbi:hypothetical protein IAT38_006432 [Cryptococcus sp. DSM 104549]
MTTTPHSHIEARAQQSRFHAATLDSTTSLDIDLIDVDLSAGGRELIAGARVHLQSGIKYGLIGRNGSGKSTLLLAIAERIIPGIAPSVRIVYVSQLEQDVDKALPKTKKVTVVEHILKSHTELQTLLEEQALLERALDSGVPDEPQKLLNQVLLKRAERALIEAQLVAQRRSGARGKKAREEEIAAELELKMAKLKLGSADIDPDCSLKISTLLSEVQLNLELLDAETIHARTRTILQGLGFSDDMMNGPFASLSGGWRSRCKLALALIVPSDVLLLDEPSNFLDLESVIWFQQYLISLLQTVVLISHDRSFIDAVSDETMIVRQNKLEYFTGTPSEMEEAERKERLGKVKQQAALDKKKKHIEASIAQGQKTAKKTGDDNRMRMVKSRTKKLEERWGNETSANGTRFKINRDLAGFHNSRRNAIEIRAEEAEVRMRLPPSAELRSEGTFMVSLENVSAGYGKKGREKVVVEGVNLVIAHGETVAFVGRNGQGKSTLAKLILGELQPLKGTVKRHPAIKIGYFDQRSVESLPTANDITPLKILMQQFESSTTPANEPSARGVLASFGLGGTLASHTPARLLSGGQKVRLALALLFYDPPNFLIMDEVSTHLDFATIQALSRELKNWKGALVLVTHDRHFCNVVTGASSIDSDDDEDSSGGSDDGLPIATPRVYYVRKGGMRLLDGGMDEYEGIVERRLAKRGL